MRESIRRTVVETMFAMNYAQKALYHGERLLEAQGMSLLDDDTEEHLENLESYVVGLDWNSEDVIFTFLGMNFLPHFVVADMEIIDDGGYEVCIPVLGREPKSFVLASDGELYVVEKALATTLMKGLYVGHNDWLKEVYTEVGLLHPVYLEVVKIISDILDTITRNSSTYELRNREEVVEYFYIAVQPRLEKILKGFAE